MPILSPPSSWATTILDSALPGMSDTLPYSLCTGCSLCEKTLSPGTHRANPLTLKFLFNCHFLKEAYSEPWFKITLFPPSYPQMYPHHSPLPFSTLTVHNTKPNYMFYHCTDYRFLHDMYGKYFLLNDIYIGQTTWNTHKFSSLLHNPLYENLSFM